MRAYRITVRYLPRSLILDGLLPPTYMSARDQAAREWSFDAEAAQPPPVRRSKVWKVRYRASPEAAVRFVLLDVRFVTEVVPL